jgi:chloramphenicol-sensitive protein RarD
LKDQNATAGLVYALLAFTWWGCVFPAFLISMNVAVGGTSSRSLSWNLEVLASRVVWTLVVCFVLIAFTRRSRELFQLLKSSRSAGLLAVTSLLISANWASFIYGTATGRLSDASLGYYISPLLNVLLGMLFLGERLTRWQWISLTLAAAGVISETLSRGELPWIALLVASTFGVYGLLRKQAAAGPVTGLTFETAYVFPLAAAYFIYRWQSGPKLEFGGESTFITWMLVAAGPFTAAPLLWFAAGAKRLTLSSLGFIQFLAPTLQLLVAVVANGEPLTVTKLLTFSLIWIGVILFAWDRAMQRPERSKSVAKR